MVIRTLILDVKTEYLDEVNELPLPLIWFGPKILDKSSSISSSDLLKQQQDKKTRLALRDEAFSILTSVIVAVLNTSYIVAKPDLKNSSLNFSGLLSLLPT